MKLRLYLPFLVLSFLATGCSAPEAKRVYLPPSTVERIAVETGETAAVSIPEKSLQLYSVDDFVKEALKRSASLSAEYSRYQAALQKSPQVSSLPDPTLNYGYFIESVETRAGPQEHKVGFAQRFPWFGKLGLKGEIADHEASAARYAFLAKKNKVVLDVTSAYFELVYLEDSIQVTKEKLELLKRWEEVLLAKLRSATGQQSDLIKVQVELGLIEDKVQELKDLKTPLQINLNSLLNLPPQTPVTVKRSESKLEKSTKFQGSENLLWTQLEESNPELLLLRELSQAKEDGVKLAAKNYYPDFSLGAEYIFTDDLAGAGSVSGDDALVGMFSITLPLYREKYDAGYKQAENEERALLKLSEAKVYELRSKLSQALYKRRDSSRRFNLYSWTLIPKAEEALESSYTSFEAGQSSFIDLLDSERSLLEFELSLSRSVADYHIATAQLGSLLGHFSEGEDHV